MKTVYEWIAKGRLDGAFRKRGKHILIWRDRALDLLFNGPDWKMTEPAKSILIGDRVKHLSPREEENLLRRLLV